MGNDTVIRGESGLPVEDELFVAKWIANGYGNAGKAYREVHPDVSKAVASEKGNALLEEPLVKAYVCGLVKQHLDKYDVTEDNIVQELANIAFLDVIDAFDEDGSLIDDIRDLPEKVRRCVSSVSESVEGKIRVAFYNKQKALEMLAKYKKLLTDMHVVSSDKDLSTEILAGRKRAGLHLEVDAPDRESLEALLE
jgi:phage terminase small subunit